MTAQRLTTLFTLYLQQQATVAEQKELWAAWRDQDPALAALKEELVDQAFDTLPLTFPPAATQSEEIFDRVLSATREEQQVMQEPEKIPVRSIYKYRRWWWAAAVLLFVVGSLWFVVDRRDGKQPAVVQTPVDIAPGREGAVLTLADGKTIVLDSMANGIVAQQNGSDIELSNGKLQYATTHSPLTTDHSPAYNTLSTPRGRQFQLALPDGTKVWLNAASSIRYPTVFTSRERRVQITGEAYFEVSKDKLKPFLVDVDGKQTVEVLGTHFNINSYADEHAIRTTLLEGKVKVSATQPETQNAKPEMVLIPGQQAELKAQQLTKTNYVDVNRAVAWKNGAFDFSGQDFAASMRQLERWYDVKVVYDGPAPAGRLGGKIGRDLTLMQVVKLLDGVVATFRLQNKELHVSK